MWKCNKLSTTLIYLHDEKNITYRDMKLENILVRFRTLELFIKLYDFDLSTEKRYLITHCETKFYTTTKIFIESYTNAINIWAIEVLDY